MSTSNDPKAFRSGGPIRLFIDRPIFTTMLLLSLVVFGLFAYPKIGVDQFPEVEFPVVSVLTVLPGADPESIEKNVSEPLEEALNTLAGLDTLRSVNVEGVSQVIVQFSLDSDVDVAAQDVRDRVQATLGKLPREILTPIVQKFDFQSIPIATLAIAGPLPIEELTRLAEDEVKPALQRLEGVGAVDITGGRNREINIYVDPARLRAYGFAATDVSQAIQLQSVDLPGGRTAEPGLERVVTLDAEAHSIDELRELVIPSPGGTPVRLRDVADVVDGPAEARSSATLNGQSAVAIVIRKQSGANTVAVADRVAGYLGELSSTLPKGTQVHLVNDAAKFIRNSINGVKHDLVLGGLLAVLIVLVFLRNLRSTLVSAVALPTSVIGTFAVMYALGFTFNVITMLGLTLSIGLLIDDAIVVIENVVRHLEEGMSPREAAYHGTVEIALAVLAVTLSVMAVFIPVAFMEGMMGKFFYQFGVTVAVAVAISYFVSMTLTPMLSSRLLRHESAPGKLSAVIERAFAGLDRFYRSVLELALRRRLITMMLAIGIFIGTILLVPLLKFTFMPAQDMGMFKVSVELPQGSPLAQTEAELARLSAQLRAMPGVTSVFATAGGGVQAEVHKGELLVNLVPIAAREFNQDAMKTHVRSNLRASAGAHVTVGDYSPVSGGGARSQQVQFNLRGTNWEELSAAREKVEAAMRGNPGLVDVDSTYRSGKPQLAVELDRQRAADLGLPAALVGGALRTFLGGDKIGDYREGGETYDIRVRLPDSVLSDASALGQLPLRGLRGNVVELRNVANLTPAEGPSQIDRQALQRQITMLADLKSYSLGEAIGFLNGIAKELPPSVTTSFEGQGKELGNAGKAFLLALVLGIILVYMILAAQFESLVDPFTIMLSLPLAVVGAFGGLLLTGQYMSMFAMIGMIMLMGLVTKNGILLVDFANQLRREGASAREAMAKAGPIRFRPILMTTIAMIAGMIPVALARGDGAETRVPMAVTIIGGLITSTALTLVVVPVVYTLLDSLRQRLTSLRKKHLVEHAPQEDLAA